MNNISPNHENYSEENRMLSEMGELVALPVIRTFERNEFREFTARNGHDAREADQGWRTLAVLYDRKLHPYLFDSSIYEEQDLSEYPVVFHRYAGVPDGRTEGMYWRAGLTDLDLGSVKKLIEQIEASAVESQLPEAIKKHVGSMPLSVYDALRNFVDYKLTQQADEL